LDIIVLALFLALFAVAFRGYQWRCGAETAKQSERKPLAIQGLARGFLCPYGIITTNPKTPTAQGFNGFGAIPDHSFSNQNEGSFPVVKSRTLH
jgi:hypothetical protein